MFLCFGEYFSNDVIGRFCDGGLFVLRWFLFFEGLFKMFGGIVELALNSDFEKFGCFCRSDLLWRELGTKDVASLAGIFCDDLLLCLHCNYKSLYNGGIFENN